MTYSDCIFKMATGREDEKWCQKDDLCVYYPAVKVKWIYENSVL